MSSETIKNFLNLNGRIALITGATGNLGRVMSNALAELGADLILVDHPDVDFNELENELRELWNVKVYSYHCDLENEKSRLKLISKIKIEHKKINILINNAAFIGVSKLGGWIGSLAEQSLDTWRRALEVNLTAPFHLCQKLEPLLNGSEGANIINIGSIYGIYAPDFSLYEGTNMGNPAAYGVSKAGLDQLTKYLSTSMAPNIRVNSISPGGVSRNQPNEFVKRYIKKTPLKRMANESDFIGVVAYLASDMSLYVTGQVVQVDGGWGVW
jgi:NAD(P)-dependent dehydrogenase (short-subunit alcohol dehydrogenase family)